ncbi:hypothetical protein M0G43_14035 [Subsaxibacter sp. CAU 1640]|uniref:hypothetical protein n=1 Tax=Subsaxibacter sp. CAU 1640 TaxID=2933271 RepID=UPI0020045F11|nr:hypothetical protein [Subsaxibacter sp. CAU 1640]MCK7591704.1 hypothetical protein [Subsaxibacter sp. CAU 1640]
MSFTITLLRDNMRKIIKNPVLLMICSIALFISCASESEKILNEKMNNGAFDFSNLRTNGNIQYTLNDDIQYGLIDMENGEQIKFWFLSHHHTSDIGGTIYEYPNGERQFCGGNHCCEVQFYDNGKLGRTFKNSSEFKTFVTERNGISP